MDERVKRRNLTWFLMFTHCAKGMNRSKLANSVNISEIDIEAKSHERVNEQELYYIFYNLYYVITKMA